MFEAYPQIQQRSCWTPRCRCFACCIVTSAFFLLMFAGLESPTYGRPLSEEDITEMQVRQPFLSSTGFEVGLWTRKREGAPEEPRPAVPEQLRSRPPTTTVLPQGVETTSHEPLAPETTTDAAHAVEVQKLKSQLEAERARIAAQEAELARLRAVEASTEKASMPAEKPATQSEVAAAAAGVGGMPEAPISTTSKAVGGWDDEPAPDLLAAAKRSTSAPKAGELEQQRLQNPLAPETSIAPFSRGTSIAPFSRQQPVAQDFVATSLPVAVAQLPVQGGATTSESSSPVEEPGSDVASSMAGKADKTEASSPSSRSDSKKGQGSSQSITIKTGGVEITVGEQRHKEEYVEKESNADRSPVTEAATTAPPAIEPTPAAAPSPSPLAPAPSPSAPTRGAPSDSRLGGVGPDEAGGGKSSSEAPQVVGVAGAPGSAATGPPASEAAPDRPRTNATAGTSITIKQSDGSSITINVGSSHQGDSETASSVDSQQSSTPLPTTMAPPTATVSPSSVNAESEVSAPEVAAAPKDAPAQTAAGQGGDGVSPGADGDGAAVTTQEPAGKGDDFDPFVPRSQKNTKAEGAETPTPAPTPAPTHPKVQTYSNLAMKR
mmetsp:Transcript_105126/g.304112  ORF Transcript_105126/g.304112 Transcript_105126/m.304112 type:complete len:605 (-) Transcript_105126:87-1901(-)